MKKRITTPIFVVLLLSFINVPTMTAQSKYYGEITYEKAVNISGKQRMLSQKMSKAFLLLAKGINDDAIKKELNSSKFIFEKQLQILSENAVSATAKLSIKKVKELWKEFKEVIIGTPDTQNSLRVLKLNTNLLKACNELVQSIENSFNYNNQFFKSKNKELVRTINVSGRQRMLSQRLCLYYTATTMFQRDSSDYTTVLNRVYSEFDNAIGDLLISSYNSTEIEEELGFVMSLWEKFQTNKNGLENKGFELEEIFSTTNQLTKSFNKITGLYEKSADN